MSDELITPDNLSTKFLKSILDAAMMDTSIDSDGDLSVREGINIWVFPSKEKKDRIRLLSLYGFTPGASRLERMECVNRINSEYIMVRAYVGDRDRLGFDYDIPVAGGISPKAFVLALKRFSTIPPSAINEHGKDIVE